MPPEVLAQYASVNAKADQTANTPFQTYSGQFVAPINSTQQAGIAGTTAAAGQAQPYYTSALGELNAAQAATTPYYGAATTDVNNATTAGNGLAAASLGSLNGASAAAAPLQSSAASGISSALAGAQPYQAGATGYAVAGGNAVNPSDLNAASIQKYLSPYLGTVLGSESALLNQNNQQQQAGQLGNAITSGAFGGDRAGIAAANLEQQQNLANANIYGNILNTGYNNALSTAQQQQGVGLAAGQANRAALQTTSGELQGIGEQGFEQGLGAAGAQGALGQQEYAQGANTAAQEAALGQQQFGQGLAASNQNAALAGDIYGTGAATSAATAGLGSGAQAAALQGSQAELQAGTAAQQTQQAQDTAQYNQFLQQQSYPFQVDQFLANIAEGTGALSGSTTTTTAPGGLFSDERLKEDIQPIGKTFDGQNIIKFRYKGDKKTQIGLSAQETERHHPDAVGLASGYKTVDYDKATRKAAQRGRFRSGGLATAEDWREGYAEGGSPLYPGMSQDELGSVLAAQAQMYAPYAQSGGPYGGAGGSAPRGGSSYVPQANLPVSHLAVAQPAAPSQSGLASIKNLTDIASNPLVDKYGGKAASGLAGLFKKGDQPEGSPLGSSIGDDFSSPQLIVDNTSYDTPYARGGLAGGRRGYDTGGAPYANQIGMGLDIPDDNQHPQLAVAQPPKSSSGSDALGDIASIAKLATMFIPAKRGGAIRKGYDGGGSPTNDNTDDGTGSSLIGSLESGAGDAANFIANLIRAQNLTEPEGAKAAAAHPLADNSMPSGSVRFPISPADTAQAPPPVAVSAPRVSPGGGGGGSLADVPSGLAGMVNAPIADNAPSMAGTEASPADNGNGRWGDMVAAGISGMPDDVAPKITTGLASAAPVGDHLRQPANDASAPSSGGTNPLSGIEHGAQGALGKVGDQIKGYFADPKNIPSFLTGLAAMVAAPTKYPLVALTQGLGAGAQSYLNTQQQRAQIAQTQANVGQTQAQTARAQVVTAADIAALAKSGLVPQEDPKGNIIFNGKRYSIIKSGTILNGGDATTPGANGPASPNYHYLGSTGQEAATNAPTSYFVAPPADQATSRAQMNSVVQQATDARAQLPQLLQYAQAIDSGGRGALQTGPLNAVKAAWAGNFNDVVRTLGHPEWQVQNEGLTATQVAEKMAIVTAQARASGADERSLGALQTLQHSVPNNTMTPDAANDMMMQAIVRNQRDIDRSNYYSEFNKAAQSNGALDSGFLTRDADQAFGNDHTADQYQREQTLLTNSVKSGAYQKINGILQGADPAKRTALIMALDRVSPNFHRYFTGGE